MDIPVLHEQSDDWKSGEPMHIVEGVILLHAHLARQEHLAPRLLSRLVDLATAPSTTAADVADFAYAVGASRFCIVQSDVHATLGQMAKAQVESWQREVERYLRAIADRGRSFELKHDLGLATMVTSARLIEASFRLGPVQLTTVRVGSNILTVVAGRPRSALRYLVLRLVERAGVEALFICADESCRRLVVRSRGKGRPRDFCSDTCRERDAKRRSRVKTARRELLEAAKKLGWPRLEVDGRRLQGDQHWRCHVATWTNAECRRVTRMLTPKLTPKATETDGKPGRTRKPTG